MRCPGATGVLIGLLVGLAPAVARDLHVRPGAAAEIADGDPSRPFPSVALAVTALASGDRLLLQDGDYGTVAIEGARYAPPVRVMPAPGAAPRLAGLRVRAASGWHFADLLVEAGPAPRGGALVTVGADAQDIRLERLTVRSGDDHAAWDAATWRARARPGIQSASPGIEIRDSRVTGVRHGIQVSGPDARVIGNLVDGFSGDALRGLGDRGLFEGNEVRNCVKVDDNHDDGFQSWSRGPEGRPGRGMVRGVVLRGNVIRNHIGPRGPLTCRLQGIGLFDGLYVDWLIEDNLVEVDHWTGITVMGGIGVRVLDNTVRNVTPGPPGPPWIVVTRHKDGRPGADNLIAGNRTTSLNARWRGGLRTDPRVTEVRDNLRLVPAR